MQPHRWQPTRLPLPWDSPGKHTGMGCHFLLQCMKVKSESEVTQLCLTLSDPMDCSPPGSSIPGIFQARVLESDAIAFSISHSVMSKYLQPLGMEHAQLPCPSLSPGVCSDSCLLPCSSSTCSKMAGIVDHEKVHCEFEQGGFMTCNVKKH